MFVLFFLPIQIEKKKLLDNEEQVGKMEANNTTDRERVEVMTIDK
jgi:hypothetical protein